MSQPKENPVVTGTPVSVTNTRFATLGTWLPVAIQLFTAAGFAVAYLHGSAAQLATFGKLMQMEFIVIHSGVFIGVLLLHRSESAFWRGMRWVAVALFAVLYLRIGYNIMGWVGVFEFVALTLSTYAGLFWATTSARFSIGFEIGTRWFIGFMTFAVLGGLFKMPENAAEWTVFPSVLLYGACYFASLATIEASGVYRWIRNLG